MSSFYLANARSLKSKLHNLHSRKYDQCLFTETWLNSSFTNAVLLNGLPYLAYRCDRVDGYGGVAIFVREDLAVMLRVILRNELVMY